MKTRRDGRGIRVACMTGLAIFTAQAVVIWNCIDLIMAHEALAIAWLLAPCFVLMPFIFAPTGKGRSL